METKLKRPNSAGTVTGACTVGMPQTPQTCVSINHKRRKQHLRQCWDSDWGMYGRHAADTAYKCFHLPVVPLSDRSA